MSVIIDTQSKKTVDIVSRAQTQDASGDYGTYNETVICDDVTVDIQPDSGDIDRFTSGDNIKSSHTMYPEDHLSGIASHNIVKHGSDEYEILFIADFVDHQEIKLRAL